MNQNREQEMSFPQRLETHLETRPETRLETKSRAGVIVVMSAILIVVILGMAAFGIDIGYMALMRTQLQISADAGALAAGNSFHLSDYEIKALGTEYATYHTAGGRKIKDAEVDVELGIWDADAKAFSPSAAIGNAVRVTVRRKDEALFFGRVLGNNSFNMKASAIAMANPRDIAFVVDLSGSMNDDTEPAWSTGTIDSEFAGAGYPTIGSDLMAKIYGDFGYGSFPGNLQYVGQPLGVAPDQYAYAEMTKDAGPLAALPGPYQIFSTDDETTRKKKAYQWMIDNQIAVVMPGVEPTPNASNYEYWEKYLDYIIDSVYIMPPPPPPPPSDDDDDDDEEDDDDDDTPPPPPPPPPPPSPPIGRFESPTQYTPWLTSADVLALSANRLVPVWTQAVAQATVNSYSALVAAIDPGTPPVSRGYLPPSQDGDRIYRFNNPNKSTFPSASSSLPYGFQNLIGYQTYVQFMMDHGRDLKPDGVNYVPLSINSPSCPFHSESTPGGSFSFPPSAQPMHAARRALIAAMDVVDDRNKDIPKLKFRDHVSVISFDVLSAGGPVIEQKLTGNYNDAMNACTDLQAVGDKGATTATEAGLDIAAKHLMPKSKGGEGREKAEKVVVLLTDGVANLFISSEGDIDAFAASSSSPDFYGGGYYWLDGPLMQSEIMEAAGTDMHPVGIGLGTDYDFMDRLARQGGTANKSGESGRGSGNPAMYEQQLIDLFEKIIKRPTARLVE